jgi:hypothetical protein
MSLAYAIDELYASGWTPLDTAGCSRAADGRWYPTPARVTDEFARAGSDLAVRHAQLFECFRATWTGPGGAGAVVGQTEAETSIYALAHLRRAGVGLQRAHAVTA